MAEEQALPDLNPDKPRPMTIEDWQRITQGQREAAEARENALVRLGQDLQVDRSNWTVLYPLDREDILRPWGHQAQYISLPIVDLPIMVQYYINMIETERTNRLCKCEWIIHPDDLGKPEGTRRVHKGAESPHCPVHTKFGFLLYFFDHYFRSDCPACPPDCKSCLFNRDCECYEHQPGEHYESGKHPLKCVCGNDWICPESHFYSSETTQDVTAKAVDDSLEPCSEHGDSCSAICRFRRPARRHGD